MICEVLYFITFVNSVACVKIELPAVFDYQLSWDVRNRTDFKFNVEAEMEVWLSLDSDSNDDPDLVIGGGENTFTRLRNCSQCNQILREKFHNPLSNDTVKSFWVGLVIDDLIRFGSGSITTDYQILQHRVVPATKRIWISSFPTSAGSWEMPDYLLMKIPPTLLPNTTVHWDVAGITSALLSIETCESVDLIFTTASSGNYYQVGFGDCSNTPCTKITKFLPSSTPTTMTATVNPLQCSSFTDIWISWESSARKLEVGTGHVLNQNGFVAMENLEDLNTIEKMEPSATNTTQWKLDLYGCELLSWQEWGSWETCTLIGQIRYRYRECQCAHPPSDPNFDSFLYCDGDHRDPNRSFLVKCGKWRYVGKLYSTTKAKSVITGVTKIVCMINCRQLTPPCYYMSYNKLEKLCWMHNTGLPFFMYVRHEFIPNENFKTYAYYR